MTHVSFRRRPTRQQFVADTQPESGLKMGVERVEFYVTPLPEKLPFEVFSCRKFNRAFGDRVKSSSGRFARYLVVG